MFDTSSQFMLIHIFIFNVDINSFIIPKFKIIDNLRRVQFLYNKIIFSSPGDSVELNINSTGKSTDPEDKAHLSSQCLTEQLNNNT